MGIITRVCPSSLLHSAIFLDHIVPWLPCPRGRLIILVLLLNTCRCSNVTNSCSVFLIIRLVGLAVYAQDSAHPAGLPLMCGSVGRVPGWSALGLNPVQGS